MEAHVGVITGARGGTPYRLIVPVVLNFRLLVAYFRLLAGGGQEGIVSRIEVG